MNEYWIYEWVDGRGRGVISDWKLDPTVRSRLDQKIDAMRMSGMDLLGSSGAPPFGRGLYKLRVRGKNALRPVFCKGPIQRDSEFTFLVAADEKDGKLHPPKKHAQRIARNRLESIERDHHRRQHL